MDLIHAALVCRSETHSDRFYMDVLGLEKTGVKIAPESLIRQIFNIRKEVKIVNYIGDGIHFEIKA